MKIKLMGKDFHLYEILSGNIEEYFLSMDPIWITREMFVFRVLGKRIFPEGVPSVEVKRYFIISPEGGLMKEKFYFQDSDTRPHYIPLRISEISSCKFSLRENNFIRCIYGVPGKDFYQEFINAIKQQFTDVEQRDLYKKKEILSSLDTLFI